MNGHQQNPRFPNTRCYRCAHKMNGRAALCAMPKTPTWVVEEAVCNDLLERVLTVEYMSASIKAAEEALATSQGELAGRIHEVEVELHEQKQRVSRLLAVIEQKGMNDLLERQYDRSNAHYLALTAQLANLRATEAERQQQSTRSEDLAHYVADMRTVLLEGPIQERQELLRQFIRRIVLHLDSVTIEYRFRDELLPNRGTRGLQLGLPSARGLRAGPS